MAKNVELLDNGNEILYPRTVTEQVAVTANQNLKEKLNEMDANIESVTNEVKDARTNGNTNITYNNLKARLDDEHKKLNNEIEKTNTQLSNISDEVYDFPHVRNGKIKIPDDFPSIEFDIFKKDDGDYYHNATPYSLFDWSNAKNIYIDCDSVVAVGTGTISTNPITLSLFLSNVKNNQYPGESKFVLNILNNVVAQSDVFSLTDENIDVLIRSRSLNGFTWISRFKRPGVVRETSEWIAEDGVYKTTQYNTHECIDIVNIVNKDEYGYMPKPYTKVSTLNECKTTKGTFYQNGKEREVWCNPHNSHNISHCMPLASTKVMQINVSTGNTIMFENIGFCAGSTVFNPTNLDSKIYFFGCKFFRNFNDSFAIQGLYKCYLFDCVASYASKDGFNYHSNSKDSLAVEVNCVSYCNGMYKFQNGNQTTNSNNGSTAHDGMNMLRVGGNYWLNEGPTVADVNNCYSVNYGCRVYDQLESHTGTVAGFEFYDTGSANRPIVAKKYVIDCLASGTGMDYGISGTSETYIVGFRGLKKYDGNVKLIKYSEVM